MKLSNSLVVFSLILACAGCYSSDDYPEMQLTPEQQNYMISCDEISISATDNDAAMISKIVPIDEEKGVYRYISSLGRVVDCYQKPKPTPTPTPTPTITPTPTPTPNPYPYDCEPQPDPSQLCTAPAIPDGQTPVNYVPVSSCRTLAQGSTTYLLTNDVTSTGTCFVIAANNVKLDLGGHKILYGTTASLTWGASNGIYAYNVQDLEIRNGTIEEGNLSNLAGHPIQLKSVTNAVIRNTYTVAKSQDSSNLTLGYIHGIWQIYDNRMTNQVTSVTNRHYPGDSIIRVSGGDGIIEIHDNLIDSGPQWGIKMENGTFTTSKVYNNCITGMRSLFANAYAIEAYTDGNEIYGNYINTESKGIHVTGENNVIRNNYVEVWERPNDEYGSYFTHGIRVEGATDAQIFCNEVLAKADADHGDAYALRISGDTASSNEIFNNIFEAKSFDFAKRAYAISLLGLAAGNLDIVHDNTFKSDYVIFCSDWDGAQDMTFLRNIFERTSGRTDFVTFSFMNGSEYPSTGHLFIDTEVRNGAGLRDINKRLPAAVSLDIGWSFDLTVKDRSGNLVAAASVAIRDADGVVVSSGLTDAGGKYKATIYEFSANGPSDQSISFDEFSPHAILVTSGNKSYSRVMTINAPTVLEAIVQ